MDNTLLQTPELFNQPSPYDLAEPGSVTTTEDRAKEKRFANEQTFFGLVDDAVKSDWQTSWTLWNAGLEDTDPNWVPSKEQWKQFTTGLPETYWELGQKASSPRQLEEMKAVALEDLGRQQRLASAGWEGTAIRLAVGLFDPMAIGVSAVTEGAAAPYIYGAKIGRAVRAIRAGLLTSTTNAALETFNPDPKSDWGAVAQAAGYGMLFGAAFGSLRRNPATIEEARMMDRIGQNLIKDGEERMKDVPGVDPDIAEWERMFGPSTADESSVGGKSVGAAENQRREGVLGDAPELDPQHAPQSAYGNWRYDSVGQLGKSKSPIARLIGAFFGEETVGYKDRRLVPISASEWGSRRYAEDLMSFNQTFRPAWADYAERQGMGWFKRRYSGRAQDEFMQQVSDFIEERDPTKAAQYDPSVQKVGNALRDRYALAADEMYNPGMSSGETRAPLRGAEFLEKDKHYIPYYSDPQKINSLLERFSTSELVRLAKAAITKAIPDVDEAIIDKMASGWLRRITSAGYGITDPLAGLLRGRSKDTVKAALDELGIAVDDAQLDDLVRAIARPEGTSSSRLKKRTSMDRSTTLELEAFDGKRIPVSIKDFFDRDAEKVFMRYSREHAGRVALARMQVVDPSAPSTMLIDGIRSREDFDKLLDWIRNDYARISGSYNPKALKGDIENMEYLYRSILGQPHHTGEAYVAWMRRAREYNFVRLMNRMGLAQLQEASKVITSVGLKAALTQMPTLRRVMRGDRSVLVDDLARELEAAGMFRNDAFLGTQKFRVNEEMWGEKIGHSTSDKIGHGLDRALTSGKAVTSHISLMKYVNSYLQQWASRTIAQKFVDLAFKNARMIGKDADRFKVLGLDEARLDKIYEQIRAHAKVSPAGRLHQLNFEQWDPTVRAQFLGSLYRYTRKVIQENDAGGMARWMSKPGAQLFFQFRSFVLGAWSKSTLYNLHHMDGRALVGLLAEIVMGSATYAVNVYANSSSRKDAQEYLDKELSWGRLITAGFGRASIASIIPTVSDSLTTFTPWGALFDARTSATPTQLIGGFPVLDALNSAQTFTRGTIDSFVSDRKLSQREIFAGARTMPFGNWWPLVTALGKMVDDRPYMEPRGMKESYSIFGK